MKNKLIYIANIRLPTEKAHGIQIMEMCSAFADQGVSVELVVPKRLNPIKDHPFDYYHTKRNFSIRRLFCIDLVKYGKIGFLIEMFSFTERVTCYALFKKNALFYTRDELIAFYLMLFGKRVVWEGHRGDINWILKILLRRKVKMVMISKALKSLYVSLGGQADKILVSPDAVDIGKFAISISKDEARKKTGLPLDKKIVLYTGHLYSWKGAQVLAEAAKEFPSNVIAVFVGGTENDIQDFENTYKTLRSVVILGKKPYQEIPLYLRAADVLVIPNSAKEDISRLYTSPMKMFEYMASGTPIVASNLPSLREILTENIATFTEPDNPRSFTKVILDLLSNPEKMVQISAQSVIESKKYSWEHRAKSILEFSGISTN